MELRFSLSIILTLIFIWLRVSETLMIPWLLVFLPIYIHVLIVLVALLFVALLFVALMLWR